VNYGRQFARHLRAELCLEAVSVTKYGGLPFGPGEIVERVKEIAGDLEVVPAAETEAQHGA
jgi:hypothetical protein